VAAMPPEMVSVCAESRNISIICGG
jgi:hypothetical protein